MCVLPHGVCQSASYWNWVKQTHGSAKSFIYGHKIHKILPCDDGQRGQRYHIMLLRMLYQLSLSLDMWIGNSHMTTIYCHISSSFYGKKLVEGVPRTKIFGQNTWNGTLWFVETKLCFDWLRQSCFLRKTLNGGSGLFLIATQMMVNKNQGTVESHSQLLWNFVLGLAKCV